MPRGQAPTRSCIPCHWPHGWFDVRSIGSCPRQPQAEANDPIARQVYDETLGQCLDACKETLQSMVAPPKVKATAVGDEKVRHAGWLDQVQTFGVALTKEQIAEIRHAIVKGRPHLAAKMMSQNPPNVPGASGSGAASSSGTQRPYTPRRSPSRT